MVLMIEMIVVVVDGGGGGGSQQYTNPRCQVTHMAKFCSVAKYQRIPECSL